MKAKQILEIIKLSQEYNLKGNCCHQCECDHYDPHVKNTCQIYWEVEDCLLEKIKEIPEEKW